MRAFKLLLFSSVAAAFIFAGFSSALTLGNLREPSYQEVSARLEPSQENHVAANGQRNLLIIGVDSLQSDNPSLQSLWLALNIATHNPERFILLPLFPSAPDTALVSSDKLESTFSLQNDGIPSADFLDALKDSDFWWSYYVVLDEDGLTKLVDLSGGLDLGSGTWNGSQVVSSIETVVDQGNSEVQHQTNLLRAFCSQQSKSLIRMDAGKLYRKLAGHMVTDLPVERFSQDWLAPLVLAGYPSCEFPTLQTSPHASVSD